MGIKRPAAGEYAPFYAGYVALVTEPDILHVLAAQKAEIGTLARSLPDSKQSYRYAEGKWTIGEVLSHLIDGERVFGYRAFCISRGEQAALPGFDENQYVSRLIAAANPTDGSVVLFESDFGLGEKVQVMRRSNEHMLASARAISSDLLHRVDDTSPFLALYIDCAGRTSGFCGAGEEEGSIIRETIGSRMPLLGCYSGVEIAPFLGGSRALDWTGVLIVLSEA